MAKIVEVPGMGNVEFPDNMNDEDIGNAIKSSMASKQGPVQPEDNTARTAFELASPAITKFAFNQPTGLTDVARGVGSAVMESGPEAMAAMKNYFSHPIANFGVDLASHVIGVPPVMAGKAALPVIGSIYDKYKSAMNNLGELSNSAQQAVRNAGTFLENVVTPGEYRQIMEQLKGGTDLSKFELPKRLAGMPEAEAFASAIKSGAPGIGQKILGTLAPVATTVGRVAGPVGNAMMAYDAFKPPAELNTGEQEQLNRMRRQNLPPTIYRGANAPVMPQRQPQPMMQPQPQVQQQPTAQNFLQRMQSLSGQYSGFTQ